MGRTTVHLLSLMITIALSSATALSQQPTPVESPPGKKITGRSGNEQAEKIIESAAESDKLQVEIEFQLEEALPGILESIPERVIGNDGSVVMRGDASNSPELASGALWVAKRSMITTQTDKAFWQSVKVSLEITKDVLTHVYGVKHVDVAIEMLIAAIESESEEEFCQEFLEWLAEQAAKGALKAGAEHVGEAAEEIAESFVVDKSVSKANAAFFEALLKGKRERITIVVPDVPGYEGSIHGDYGLELRDGEPRLIVNIAGVGRRELRGGVNLGDFNVRGEYRLTPKRAQSGNRVTIVYTLQKPGDWMVDADFAREDESADADHEHSDEPEEEEPGAKEDTPPRPVDPCRGSRDLHQFYTTKAKPLREELGRAQEEIDSVLKQLAESRSRLERAQDTLNLKPPTLSGSDTAEQKREKEKRMREVHDLIHSAELLIPNLRAEIRRVEEKLKELRIHASVVQYELDRVEARAEAARIAFGECLARVRKDD